MANLRSLGCYDVVTHIDYVFLQMFLWERVGSLGPKPTEYSDKVPGRTGVVSPAKSIFEANALRWAGEKQSSDNSSSAVIDAEGNLNFRPNVHVPIGIHRIQLSKMASSGRR